MAGRGPSRAALLAAAVAVLVVLVGLLVACAVIFPILIVDQAAGGTGASVLTGVERLNAENGVRSALLQGVAGLLALGGVAAGAAITLRQVRVNREGHTIGLFTKAINQLSSEQVSVRHGGIYALELLAELDPRYRGHIHALLTAFIRQHAPWPPASPAAGADAERARLHGGLPDDVGGAMAALSRRSMIEEGAWSELEDVDLRRAELDGFDLSRTCFVGSNLEGASLAKTDLTGTTLSHTVLRGANLSGADLRGAELNGADLTGVITDSATKWPAGLSRPSIESVSAHQKSSDGDPRA